MREASYPIVYAGSVKNIRRVREPKGSTSGQYIFEFTDDYSVFDYGKMPDRIRGKGSAIAMMSACLFEALEEPSSWKRLFRAGRAWERAGGEKVKERLRRSPAGRKLASQGLGTHYLGLLDEGGKCVRFDQLRSPSNRLLVRAVPVLRPVQVAIEGRQVWDYSVFHPEKPQFLIPLENVFRFGVPRGSSLLDRLRKQPGYARELGLESTPSEGEWLPRPVFEFFSKLEPMDRHLRLEEALNCSGLTGAQFRELSDLSFLVAVFLYNLFLERGLEIWDGKFEFVKLKSDILLADSITPDELRITFRGAQLSKEPLRQYYRREDPRFHETLDAIKAAGPPSGSIRRAVKARLGRGPKKLDPGFREVCEQMYRSLAHRVTGSPLFAQPMALEAVMDHLDAYSSR
jgi:phosphoribosylaminoimidazole-succinocarboxamide synthase